MQNFKTDLNKELTVKILKQGDKYGLLNCLTHDENEPLVEFYSGKYFISRYYAKTLLKGAVNGLCLDGGQRQFDIDLATMMSIRAFIRETI